MLKVNLKTFKLDKKEILKDIVFDIKKGENLTIIGPNGVGKSTLAKILVSIIKTDKSVKIKDTFIETLSPLQRTLLINYIPTKLYIYDSYITVYDFLSLHEHKNRIDDVLKQLSLHEHKKRFCSSLSSGEQQLLLIASALVQGAKLTIFDEPTTNLDPIKKKLVYDILKNSNYLQQKIIITHNLQFAYKLNYPILYMKNGKSQLYDNCKNFFDKKNLNNLFEQSVKVIDKNVIIDL